MNQPTYDETVEFLLRAETYPEGGPVELRETHVSTVFLTPRRAFKMLKPVDFGFLDFSTPEARQADCRAELELNRRLAPEVYRNVVPVTQSAGGLHLGGDGPPVEWLVEMVRLPDDATLQALVEAGTAGEADIDALLDVLVPFFQSAPTGPAIAADESPQRIRARLEENLDVCGDDQCAGGIPPRLVERLRSQTFGFVATQRELFARRIAEDRIRDGHGDLRAEHVYYLDSGVVVVDCIEFNDEFRHVDTLDEVCFLATDLERLGADDLAQHLVREYRRRANDDAPPSLEAFFEAYRFSVRAKVACLRAGELSGEERMASFAGGRRQLEMAVDRLAPHTRPLLLAVCGSSGSGKSTIARPLAERLGAVRLSSDVVRKEVHGLEPTDRGGPELYTAEASAKTYAGLDERARELLGDGVSVVLDATYQRRSDRAAVVELGNALSVTPLFVECTCRPETAESRVAQRSRAGTDASDADLQVLRKQRERFEPLDELPAGSRMKLDTELPVEQAVDQIVTRLGNR